MSLWRGVGLLHHRACLVIRSSLCQWLFMHSNWAFHGIKVIDDIKLFLFIHIIGSPMTNRSCMKYHYPLRLLEPRFTVYKSSHFCWNSFHILIYGYINVWRSGICLNPSPLTLKGREFRIQNKTTFTGKGGSSVYGTKPPKRRKIIIILSSLAYITPIRLLFCISTGERES